jgi:hypothetical protein
MLLNHLPAKKHTLEFLHNGGALRVRVVVGRGGRTGWDQKEGSEEELVDRMEGTAGELVEQKGGSGRWWDRREGVGVGGIV